MNYKKSLLALTCLSSVGLCHDNNTIHPLLTDRAYEFWTKRGNVFEALGLEESANLAFQRPSGDQYPLDPLARTASAWLRQGSIDEDLNPDLRCLAHFYNPLPQNGAGHNLTDPTNLGANDSFEWASAGNGIFSGSTTSGGENKESWRKAREYHFTALTSSIKTDRDAKFAHLFYSLGKIVHLIQDLSQPDHSRNDAHMINGDETPGPTPPFGIIYPSARWIENYGRDNINEISNWGELSDVAELDWRTGGLVRMKDFWDRNLYQGQGTALDDDAAMSPGKTLGLSEFANGNFLGEDATYFEIVNAELATNPARARHLFPHPSLADTNYASFVTGSYPVLESTWESGATQDPPGGIMRNSIFLAKERAGVHTNKHAVLNYSTIVARKMGINKASVTINAPSVIAELHRLTLPRAISYSSGLIDYFFRGTIEARSSATSAGVVEVVIVNRSGMAMSGGAFTLYFDNASGLRTPIQGVTVRKEDGSVWGDSSRLEDGESVKAAYTPYGGVTANGRVVYKGTIGADDTTSAPLDPVDDSKAIATRGVTILTGIPNVPVLESRTANATRARRGYQEFVFGQPTNPKIIYRKSVRHFRDDTTLGPGTYYSTNTWWGTCTKVDFYEEGYAEATDSTEYPIDDSLPPITTTAPGPHGSMTYYYTTTLQPDGVPEDSEDTEDTSYGAANFYKYDLTQATPTSKTVRSGSVTSDAGGISGFSACASNNPQWVTYKNNHIHAGDETLSLPYTLDELKTNTASSIPSFQGNWTTGALQALTNVTIDELTCSLRRAQYRMRVPLAQGYPNAEYSVSWVERFIPESGTGVTSIEVLSSGNGYLTPPAVTISAPSGSGTPATATAILNANGGVERIDLTNVGNGYTQTPTVSIAAPPAGGNKAVVAMHLGSETTKSFVWSGTVPAGYSPSDHTTWPVSSEFLLSEPATDGTTTVANTVLSYKMIE